MTKNELNEIIDSCFIHLTVMKQHYTKPRNYSLDVIEQGNLDQINDLLNDITNGIELGGFNELEAPIFTKTPKCYGPRYLKPL